MGVLVLIEEDFRFAADVDQLLIRRPESKGLRIGQVLLARDLKGVELSRAVRAVEALMHLAGRSCSTFILHGAVFNGIAEGDSFKLTGGR